MNMTILPSMLAKSPNLTPICTVTELLNYKDVRGTLQIPLLIHQKQMLPITRPDTRLPKSRAGGQRPYLRSADHLGRSSEVK